MPDDPKTTEQLSRRDSFRFINKIWNFLPQPLFNSIWKTASTEFNQHNIFVKENQNSNSQELNFDSISLSVGALEPVFEIKSIKYPEPSKRCIFSWDKTIISNGLPTDNILLILIDCTHYKPSQNNFMLSVFIEQSYIRNNGTGVIVTPNLVDVDCLEGFISVVKYPILSSLNVSFSKYKKVEIF